MPSVPVTMSDAWNWTRAEMHCEATEPVGELRQARVAEEILYLSPAIIQA